MNLMSTPPSISLCMPVGELSTPFPSAFGAPLNKLSYNCIIHGEGSHGDQKQDGRHGSSRYGRTHLSLNANLQRVRETSFVKGSLQHNLMRCREEEKLILGTWNIFYHHIWQLALSRVGAYSHELQKILANTFSGLDRPHTWAWSDKALFWILITCVPLFCPLTTGTGSEGKPLEVCTKYFHRV